MKHLKSEAPKIPKTWSELKETNKANSHCIHTLNDAYLSSNNNKKIIEKSALALLKIHQLIEIGYGGCPTMDEKLYKSDKIRTIGINFDYDFYIEEYTIPSNNIAFKSELKAREFLAYPENIQLLKDYFMI